MQAIVVTLEWIINKRMTIGSKKINMDHGYMVYVWTWWVARNRSEPYGDSKKPVKTLEMNSLYKMNHFQQKRVDHLI